MIQKLFSIKDIKSGFTNIFMAVNEAVAMRDFGTACSNPESNLNKYPDDYELNVIGVIDTENGIIDTEIRALCKATAYVKIPEEQ